MMSRDQNAPDCAARARCGRRANTAKKACPEPACSPDQRGKNEIRAQTARPAMAVDGTNCLRPCRDRRPVCPAEGSPALSFSSSAMASILSRSTIQSLSRHPHLDAKAEYSHRFSNNVYRTGHNDQAADPATWRARPSAAATSSASSISCRGHARRCLAESQSGLAERGLLARVTIARWAMGNRSQPLRAWLVAHHAKHQRDSRPPPRRCRRGPDKRPKAWPAAPRPQPDCARHRAHIRIASRGRKHLKRPGQCVSRMPRAIVAG